VLHLALSAFIAFLLPLSIAGSVFTYRWMKRPTAGRVGQFCGGLVFLAMGVFLAYMTYEGMSDELIHCFGRTCSDYYSMTKDPGMFWLTSAVSYAATIFVLALGFAAIRLSIVGPACEP
jgi:hypothetical protein